MLVQMSGLRSVLTDGETAAVAAARPQDDEHQQQQRAKGADCQRCQHPDGQCIVIVSDSVADPSEKEWGADGRRSGVTEPAQCTGMAVNGEGGRVC